MGGMANIIEEEQNQKTLKRLSKNQYGRMANTIEEEQNQKTLKKLSKNQYGRDGKHNTREYLKLPTVSL